MGVARDVCYRALRRLQVLGTGETPGASDYALMLEKLGVLTQSLVTEGAHFPRMSAVDATISWSGGTPSYVTAPANYHTGLMLYRTDTNGYLVPLRPMTVVEWSDQADKTSTGTPDRFFDGPDGKWYLSPIPTADPGIKATYLETPDAVSDSTGVDFPAYWELALEYGLTYHAADDFNRDAKTWLAEWERLRSRALATSVHSASIVMTLED